MMCRPRKRRGICSKNNGAVRRLWAGKWHDQIYVFDCLDTVKGGGGDQNWMNERKSDWINPRVHNSWFSGAIQTRSCSANTRELSSTLTTSHPSPWLRGTLGETLPEKGRGLPNTSKPPVFSTLSTTERGWVLLWLVSGAQTGNLQRRSQKRTRAARGAWDQQRDLPWDMPGWGAHQLPPSSWQPSLGCTARYLCSRQCSEDKGLRLLCIQPFQIKRFDVIRSWIKEPLWVSMKLTISQGGDFLRNCVQILMSRVQHPLYNNGPLTPSGRATVFHTRSFMCKIISI